MAQYVVEESDLGFKSYDIGQDLTYSSGQVAYTGVAISGGSYPGQVLSGGTTSTASNFIDFEMSVSLDAPTGTGIQAGPIYRWKGRSGNPASGYQIYETTSGDPKSWDLVKITNASTSSATLIKTFTPQNVTSYPVKMRIIVIGSDHYVKIWNGSTEPDWTYGGNAIKITDSSYTDSGYIGFLAWNLDASTEKITWTDFTFSSKELFTIIAGGNLSSTTDASSWNYNISALANEPMWLVIGYAVGAGTVGSISSISPPANVTVSSSALYTATFGSSTKKLEIYSMQATQKVTTQSLTINFSAQQGAIISHVGRIRGGKNSASDGSAAFGTIDPQNITTSGGTTTGSLSFSNPNTESLTIYSGATNLNSAITPENTTLYASNVGTPAFATATGYKLGNDTNPSMTHSSTAQRVLLSAEVFVDDYWYTLSQSDPRPIYLPPEIRKIQAINRASFY